MSDSGFHRIMDNVRKADRPEYYDNAHRVLVRRAGGWFVTGLSWSGPWKTEAAAALARDGKYEEARAAGGLAHRG